MIEAVLVVVFQKVQSAIDKSVSNPKLKGLLERLKDYPNIPRKKIKFVVCNISVIHICIPYSHLGD